MAAADEGDENMFDQFFVADDNPRHFGAQLIKSASSADDALFNFRYGLHVATPGGAWSTGVMEDWNDGFDSQHSTPSPQRLVLIFCPHCRPMTENNF